jgi:hypothetical protein
MSKTSIRRLKRNFGEVVRKQKQDGNNGIIHVVDQFNDILEDLKQDFPDSRVQDIDAVEATKVSIGNSGMKRDLDEIRIKTFDIIEYLGLEQEDFLNDPDEKPLVQIQQKQSQSQTTNIQVNLESIRQNVKDNYESEEKEELLELINEFKEELEEENVDESKLKSLYKEVALISRDVAGQLIAYAVKSKTASIISFLV